MSTRHSVGYRERFWKRVDTGRNKIEEYFRPEEASKPLAFDTVRAGETAIIARRRKARGIDDGAAGHPRGPLTGLTGLALSGGGIRSATYSLGVMQSLHKHGLLKGIDYLSTVSGGGFAGGWLTAWLCRHQQAFPPDERLATERDGASAGASRDHGLARMVDEIANGVTPQVATDQHEVQADRTSAGRDAIHHVRLYANYLTPRKGVLSLDSWRAATTIGRDVMLTNAVLLPILVALVLLAELYFVAFDATWLKSAEPVWQNNHRLQLAAIPLAAIAAWFIALSAMWLRFVRHGDGFNTIVIGVSIASSVLVALFAPIIPVAEVSSGTGGSLDAALDNLGSWGSAIDTSAGRIVLVWLAGAIALMSYALGGRGGRLDSVRVRARLERCQTALLVIGAAVGAAVALGGYGHEFGLFLQTRGSGTALDIFANNLKWIPVAMATLGSIYTIFMTSPSASADARATEQPSRVTAIVFAITPVAVLLVLALASAFVAHWAIDKLVSRPLGAPALLRYCAGVLLVMCAYGALVEARFEAMKQHKRGRLATNLTAAVLMAMTIPAVILPFSVYLAAAALACAAYSLMVLRAALATIGNTRPAWLLGGGFLSVAALTAIAAGGASENAAFAIGVALIGAVLGWVMAIGWFADPNALSLHAFYRARLVRGFLGASNKDRGEKLKDIRDFDANDDLPLSCAARDSLKGPYHLINATLNLTAGRDLASAQRSSDRFLLSPLYCGSSRTLYRPTKEYMADKLQLGTAMAISGAAVSPVMGSVSPTAALSMLLTILNVRLGFWAPTPNKPRWREESASLWPFYLLFEMTSQTNELASYCYLTDGGHFDNTGLYSLIERGCRNIVLADCGADAKPCFEDLGTAIRRCRIDFGTTIDIDLTPAMKTKPDDRQPFLVGRITYHPRHAAALGMDEPSGVLIVLKPTVGPGDTADVRQYALQNATFPQHVTTDQWFDEAQFESYRQLGELTMDRLLEGAEKPIAQFQRRSTPAALNVLFDHVASRVTAGVRPNAVSSS
jgi:hypothetical protein